MKLVTASIILSFFAASSLSVAEGAPSALQEATGSRRFLLSAANGTNASETINVMTLNMSAPTSEANVTLGVCRPHMDMCVNHEYRTARGGALLACVRVRKSLNWKDFHTFFTHSTSVAEDRALADHKALK